MGLARVVTAGMGSLGLRLGRKFLTVAAGDVLGYKVAKPTFVRKSEV